MNEYYGNMPYSESLAHYGVKGMKWGVRKAIEKGNMRRLDRHYRKAAKKLAKLNARTDISKQKELSDKWNKVSKGSRITGHVGLGLAVSGTGAKHLLQNVGLKKIKALDNANVVKIHGMNQQLHGDAAKYFGISRSDIGNHLKDIKTPEDARKFQSFIKRQEDITKESIAAAEQNQRLLNNNFKMQDISNTVRNAGLGMAIGGYGYAAGAKIRAHQAKKRTTAEGHRKAIADRNAWRNQMQDVFKGTKYANLPSLSSNNKRRKRVR